MEKTAHDQIQRRFAPPRTFVLISALAVVAIAALLVGHFRDAPDIAAQATSYDLCDRQTAVRHEILLALQYPNRNRHGTAPASWGTLNASYPQATWGTLNTANNDGVYTTDPCSTSGASLPISASALASDAVWDRSSRGFDISESGLTQLRRSDFVGLTDVEYIYISGNGFATLPDDVFQGIGVRIFKSGYGNSGLAPSCKWFGTSAPSLEELESNNNGLAHWEIPYDAYDACFDTAATTPATASKLARIKLERQQSLGHVNLRWFAKLTNLDYLELDNSLIDTFYYADGTDASGNMNAPVNDRASKRYTDGSKATEGSTDVETNDLATRDALGAAIKAEIDRFWTAGSVPADNATGAGVGLTGRVDETNPGFNLCDPYDRHPVISALIVRKFRDPDADSNTAPPTTTEDLGCDPGDEPYLTKQETYDAYRFRGWDDESFRPNDGSVTELRKSDIKGLNIRSITLTGTSIRTMAPRIFEDVRIELFDARWARNLEFNPEWFGNQASTVTRLLLTSTRTNNSHFKDFDSMDGFTGLQELDLRDTDIGYINTRWFERLPSLSRIDLRSGPRLARWYYDTDGNVPHAADSNGTDYWTGSPIADLLTDINTRRSTWGAAESPPVTMSTVTFRGTPDPALAIGICNRSKVVWADLMRNFRLIDGAESWRRLMNEGDVRHSRYATLSQNDCVAVPGVAINKSTLATVDHLTTAYDSTVHSTAIFEDGRNIDLYLYDVAPGANGIGPTLKPADFENFQFVRSLYLDRSGITDIPANTFAEANNLQTLSLAGNSLNDADFTGTNFLRNLPRLRTLTLDDNLLTEFDSSWVSSSTQGSLKTLRLSRNPITDVDVSNLDLTELRLTGTQITSLDESVFDLNNLATWWYQTPTLRLDGLHEDGTSAYLNALPGTLSNTESYHFIGNEQFVNNDDLNQQALDFRLGINARLKEINDADAGNDVVASLRLIDPCQGSSCLSDADKNSFIDNLSTFDGLDNLTFNYTNLSSAQVATALRAIKDQQMRRITIEGNPNAFGASFDNSVIADVFNNRDWQYLWQLRIVDSGLTFEQSRQILANLSAGAYSHSIRRDGDGNIRWNANYLVHLDFSDNPALFTGVTTDQLSTYLNGVTAIRPGYGPFTLWLKNTNLNFDQFKAIVDSIQQYQAAPHNAHGIQGLDISENPNLWDGATEDQIKALFYRLRGLTSLDISDTGLSADQVTWIMDALQNNGDVARDPSTGRVTETDQIKLANININLPFSDGLTTKSANARMTSLSLAGNNLGAIDPSSDPDSIDTGLLDDVFNDFKDRFNTAAPALRTLDLSRTQIDCADLQSIREGLTDAGVIQSITTLTLDGNPDLFSNCVTSSGTDAVSEIFASFSNLRSLSIDELGLEFDELERVVEGLKDSSSAENDMAVGLRSFSVEGNMMAFSGATDAQVVAVFNALPNAYKALRSTGLTATQAQAVLVDLTAGQSDDEQAETERRFGAQNPAFAFRTPLPTDLRVQSGRSSIQIAFTHNPMYQGNPFIVQRYEYRYRVRPTDLDEPWGTSSSELWRTASLMLGTTGEKLIPIFGLDPNNLYQVQLRASSLAQPAIGSAVGGPIINIPLIKRIEPAITEVSLRAGDQVRLEVEVYGTANRPDNTIPDKKENEGKITFQWSDGSAGGKIDGDERRITYTAPSLPGEYIVSVEAQPLGVCIDHHKTNFGVTAADRLPCQATFTINVSRAPTPPEEAAEPINPSGAIPTSLTDANGMAYAVFTPVDGGTFADAGVTVSADKGAVPDRQILGISAAVSEVQAPEPTPGARMTIAGNLFDINGIQNAGDPPVLSYRLDDPLTVCIPMPTEFSANISDIVVIERKSDGSYGILSTKLRQQAGELNVCGSVSTLPATVGVAKLGVVPEPPVVPTPEVVPPETGATAPSSSTATFALGLGIALIAMAAATAAAVTAIRRRRSSTSGAPTQ